MHDFGNVCIFTCFILVGCAAEDGGDDADDGDGHSSCVLSAVSTLAIGLG